MTSSTSSVAKQDSFVLVSVLSTVFVVIAVFAIFKVARIGSREVGLPPGPPTKPLIGNLGIFPRSFLHYKCTEWARTYGPILSLKMGPKTAIVLTGIKEIQELMDQRSGETVDRPLYIVWRIIFGEMYMAIAPYGEIWKTLRRASHAVLSPQATDTHLPIQKAESIQLLYDTMQSPDRFIKHTLRYTESVALSILFGTRCPSDQTKEFITFHHYGNLLSRISEPGGIPPVDLIPALQYIPERWAKWKTLSWQARDAGRELTFGLLAQTEERLRRGKGNGSFMEEIINRQEEFRLNREMVAGLGAVLLEGATETTASFLQTLILLLTAFPEVQKRAQEEVDLVIGEERVPCPEDFERLPYVKALVKEVHRFRPVLPLSLPHAALEDIHYKGYLIPKGATIFINTWGVYHDPDLFDDPESFNPERYLKSELGTKSGVDNDGLKSTLHFGSGRRICPGLHLANNSIMLASMNLLWAFNFGPGARPVDIWDYKPGVASAPSAFESTVTVRGEGRKAVIEAEFANATGTFKLFEDGLSSVDKEKLDRTRTSGKSMT